jgi:hypothetical protein
MILAKKGLSYSLLLTALLLTQPGLAASKMAQAEHKNLGDTKAEAARDSTNPFIPYVDVAKRIHDSVYEHLLASDDFIKLQGIAHVFWLRQFGE